MLKSELVKNITIKYKNLSETEVRKAVDSILEKISTGLKNNQRIEIRGFGSFAPRIRKNPNARNPKTNEKVTVANKITVHFKYGKELFTLINGKNN